MQRERKEIGFCLMIRRTERILNSFFNNELNKMGLDIKNEHWLILQTLCTQTKMTQQSLADFHQKDKTYITRAIDFLEKKKWVKRISCTSDRRNKYVKLTSEGKAFIQTHEEIILRAVTDSIAKGLTPEEAESIKGLLQKFNEGLTIMMTGKQGI